VNSVSFSSDQKTLASGSLDDTIRIWELSSGKGLLTLQGYADRISFSPDGKTLASGSWDKTVRIWELSSGKELLTLKGHTDDVTSVSFSPDGKTLASGSLDKTVRLWELSSGKELLTLKGHTESVYSVSFSPDGKTLTSGSLDCTVRIWNISSGKELLTLKGHTSYVTSVSFSPDGKTLTSGSWDRTVRMWELATGKCLHILTKFMNRVNSVAWDPNGKWLVTGDHSGAVKKWSLPEDLTKNPPLLVWSSHGTQGLHCKNTQITQVTGLSSNNIKLLQENSSTGTVSQTSSKKILFARDQIETVEESCNAVFGCMENGEQLGLMSNNWVVSLAYKSKDSEHAFLILEGIENKKRAIYRAEVFLDLKRENKKYNVPFYGPLGFGYAYVQIKPMTRHDAEELAKQCLFRSEAISKKQANNILELIRKDADETELKYNNPGNSKLYAIALGKTEYGNCLTFAEKWLKGSKVKFVDETNWTTTLSPFDITSRRSYLTPNDTNERTTGSICLLQ
jgi:hypothetical protein